ncbi:zonular occludens toxin [Gammaproteobacteria bacterium ESL0073]|nr:zonular occludens toxin [Gammaproteobacteria bacterium ESL0073]
MGESVTIRTGKMGHGKTLNAIKEIDEQAKRENRIVYYHNIDGLQPDKLQAQWYEFENPHLWYELPGNTIIVIDEAQRFFGVRDPRMAVPKYISELETIRHQGQEIVFITQDHRFLDVNIRRLCGSHIHFKRALRSSGLVRYAFMEASDYDKAAVLVNADKTYTKLDKKLFGSYKSASDHHFKLEIPKKFYLFGAILLLAAYLIYSVFSHFFSKSQSAEELNKTNETVSKPLSLGSVVSSVASSATQGATGGKSKEDRPMTKDEYLAYYQPRVEGLPQTAPAYDKLTEPQAYPRLSCVMTESETFIKTNKGRIATKRINNTVKGCACYTQQASVYLVPFNICKNIVENGYFDPARPDYSPDRTIKGKDTNPLAKN